MKRRKVDHPPCTRFEQVGMVRVGQATIETNGQLTMLMNLNNRAWKCLDCGKTVWLNAAVDPNLDGIESAGKAKR